MHYLHILIGTLGAALVGEPEAWISGHPWLEGESTAEDFMALLSAKAATSTWEIFGAPPHSQEDWAQWQDILFYQALSVLASWMVDPEMEVTRSVLDERIQLALKAAKELSPKSEEPS